MGGGVADACEAAREAERGPAKEIIPDRLHWPAYLIEKLSPVCAQRNRPT